MDVIALLQDLIRCPSVTPHDAGALIYLEKLLTAHGFTCHLLSFSDKDTPDVLNLYARYGTADPNFCFAGHTDVVPVGNASQWTVDPFSGAIRDGYIYGRGTSDMKGAVAAFVAAALEYIKDTPELKGSISLLLTGDEEGPSINGTRKVLHWLQERGERIDFCLVGEPTSREKLGDMMKIGRRGTFTGRLSVQGIQGHVAYPHLADNPISKLVHLLKALDDAVLDEGTTHFQPSNLEVVSIEGGGVAENVIPATAKAVFNVRFNDTYTGDTLEERLRAILDSTAIPYTLTVKVGGESFYTPPGTYSDIVQHAVQCVTGIVPELSTTGGTSDARFIKAYCPVVEFGITGLTAHKTDERVLVSEVEALKAVYRDITSSFFSKI